MNSSYEGLKPDVKWVPSTLRGFRQWQLSIRTDRSKYSRPQAVVLDRSKYSRPQAVVLEPMVLSIPWHDGRLTAKCFIADLRREMLNIPKHDDAPFPGCDCGIYALSFPSEYRFGGTVGQFPTKPYFEKCTVNGVVKCGGKTYFGTLGFKTTHALIEAVHLPAPTTEYEFQVREVFKATFSHIAVFSDIMSMYEQYPMDDFSSLFSPDKLERMREAQLEHIRRRDRYYRQVNISFLEKGYGVHRAN